MNTLVPLYNSCQDDHYDDVDIVSLGRAISDGELVSSAGLCACAVKDSPGDQPDLED